MIPQNQYYSYNTGTLPDGCKMCVKGEKLVLFVTGICPRSCYFCPVSDEKYQHDGIYANERIIKVDQDLLDEAKVMDAKGAGITGGDPLMKLDRTVHYIKLLKQTFGQSFHIHLYTSLNLVTEKTLQKLHEAGLDEIRFHLDLESEKFYPNLSHAKKFNWKIGIEVPCIPTKQTELQNVIDYAQDKVDFVNLNELEIADNSQSTLSKLGYKTKDQASYAIKDSATIGLKLLEYAKSKSYNTPIHLCTAKLKDAIQLTNRLERQSIGAAHSFDKVHKDGLLERAAIYLPDLEPGIGYRNKLKTTPLEPLIEKLKTHLQSIKTKLNLKDTDILLDTSKPRILLSVATAKKNKNTIQKLGLHIAVVKEYPTADQLEIEVDFLK